MISIKLFWTYAIVSCGTFFCNNDDIQQAGLQRQLREKKLPDLKYCRSIFDLPHKHMELSPCSPKKVYYVELGGIFMFIIDRNIVWRSCPYCLWSPWKPLLHLLVTIFVNVLVVVTVVLLVCVYYWLLCLCWLS